MNKKNPQYEANKLAYKLEGLRRANLRKEKRKDRRQERYRIYGKGDATCPDCLGTMVWCCEQWSKICCHDYGTCPCN